MSGADEAECEICGLTQPRPHVHGLSAAESSALGLRPLTTEHRESFERAVRALEQAVSARVKVHESLVLEAPGWWFLPYGCIGCAGHVVDKATLEVTPVPSSSRPLALGLWGYQRGALRPCTLVIERVHDRQRAAELIGALDNRSPFNPVPVRADGRWLDAEEVLASLPASVPSASLWFALAALREAERSHAFDFRIEP